MSKTIECVRDLMEYALQTKGEPESQSPPWFKDQSNLWFRGHAQLEWLLQPQVLRDDFTKRASILNPNAFDSAFSFEASLFNQFRRRGHHLLPASDSLVHSYFLAQHLGLPTRLLDWSTNPLVALFFAVVEHPESNGSLIMMRARHEINGQEQRDITYQDDPEVANILSPLFNRAFVPTTISGLPLRIMPDSQAGRMLQQEACFTLHQPGCQKLDEVSSSGFIEKLVIPSSAKRKIRNELRFLGVHWGTLFPDLTSLVKQIRNEAQA